MTAALLAACLACIIMGEAGNCDTRTQIVVAHVWTSRQQQGIAGGWYGYAEPTPLQLRIAREWAMFTDPTAGAIMLVSDADLDAVAPYTRHMTETWTSSRCANGQRLHAFARSETP